MSTRQLPTATSILQSKQGEGEEVGGVVATPGLSSKGEADYPSRNVPHSRKSVDDLQGGSYIVVSNKTAAGEVSGKAGASTQGRKSVDDLQGGSYIVVTNDKKRDASTKGFDTTPQNSLSEKTAGASSIAAPPVLQSNASESKATEESSRTTPPFKVDKASVDLPAKAVLPAAQTSGKDLGDSTPNVAEPLHSVVPDRKASITAVATTPSTPLDRKPVGISAKLGSPPTATKNGDVSVKGPSVIQSPTVDTKAAELPRRTVWPPVVQPNASDKKPEDVTSVRSRSPIVTDKVVGERPTSRAAQSHEADSKIGSLATKPTSPLAQSVNKEEDDPPGVSSKRLWIPIVAGACALVGTLLAYRFRGASPVEYQVREGDTLYGISKKTGKENWENLARINPQISNPDLIYPSNRLKLN